MLTLKTAELELKKRWNFSTETTFVRNDYCRCAPSRRGRSWSCLKKPQFIMLHVKTAVTEDSRIGTEKERNFPIETTFVRDDYCRCASSRRGRSWSRLKKPHFIMLHVNTEDSRTGTEKERNFPIETTFVRQNYFRCAHSRRWRTWSRLKKPQFIMLHVKAAVTEDSRIGTEREKELSHWDYIETTRCLLSLTN